MACDLDPQCNFLYRDFTCNLPEDTIDMDVTVHTLKGIHTFWKYCNTQTSSCSPWDTWVQPFPSLRTKMKDYIEEHQNIINPFATNREYPTDPAPHYLLRSQNHPNHIYNLTIYKYPTKRRHMETKHNIKKLCKPRRVDKTHSKRFRCNQLALAKAVETMPQNPILIQPASVPLQLPQSPMHSQLQYQQQHLPSQW